MSNMVQAMSESAAATGVSAGSAEFPPPTTRAGEEGNKHRRQQQKYKVRAIPFLRQLKKMIEEEPEVIKWDDGNIIIPDPKQLEKTLPLYYKHNNYASFQRQLNNFGYHRKFAHFVVNNSGQLDTVYHKLGVPMSSDIKDLLTLRPVLERTSSKRRDEDEPQQKAPAPEDAGVFNRTHSGPVALPPPQPPSSLKLEPASSAVLSLGAGLSYGMGAIMSCDYVPQSVVAAVSFEVATGDERSRVSEDRDDLREDHILAFDALEGLDYGGSMGGGRDYLAHAGPLGIALLGVQPLGVQPGLVWPASAPMSGAGCEPGLRMTHGAMNGDSLEGSKRHCRSSLDPLLNPNSVFDHRHRQPFSHLYGHQHHHPPGARNGGSSPKRAREEEVFGAARRPPPSQTAQSPPTFPRSLSAQSLSAQSQTYSPPPPKDGRDVVAAVGALLALGWKG